MSLGVVVSGSRAPAADEPAPAAGPEEAFLVDPELARWEDRESGAVVTVDAPATLHGSGSVEVRAVASLGYLKATWSEGPFPIEEGETITLTLSPPVEAFLDPAAVLWLTDLSVVVDVAGAEVGLPEAFVDWRDGPADPARVWTTGAAAELAPRGTFDAVAVARAESRGLEGRLGPPLLAPRVRARREVPRLRETAHDTGFGGEP